LQEVLQRYYQVRGWDADTGVPTAQKLAELGLNQFSQNGARP